MGMAFEALGLALLPRGLRRRFPAIALLQLMGFQIPVKSPLEIPQCDHKSGPAVQKARFENIMFDKGP